MAASVPVVRVHALEIERAIYDAFQNLVTRQTRYKALQISQIGVGDFFLDVVPVLRAFLQIVGLIRDALDGVHARGSSRWIGIRAADDMLRRFVGIDGADGVIVGETQGTLGAGH